MSIQSAVTTVDGSEREVGFEKVFFPMLLERAIDVDRAELSRHQAGQRHQSDTVQVPAALIGLYQLVFMSLGNRAERTLDVFDLDEGELNFLSCVSLRVKVANGYLLPGLFLPIEASATS